MEVEVYVYHTDEIKIKATAHRVRDCWVTEQKHYGKQIGMLLLDS